MKRFAIMNNTDLIALVERALQNGAEDVFEETGVVLQIGDNICIVSGLTNVLFGELILFDGGNKGIVFELARDVVSIFLLFSDIPISQGEVASRTKKVFTVPVGTAFLGRVVNALAKPIDFRDRKSVV